MQRDSQKEEQKQSERDNIRMKKERGGREIDNNKEIKKERNKMIM